MIPGRSSATAPRQASAPPEALRCPGCRTKIVFADSQGLLVRNAILHVSGASGRASAKCPRCKTWVEVPLAYRA